MRPPHPRLRPRPIRALAGAAAAGLSLWLVAGGARADSGPARAPVIHQDVPPPIDPAVPKDVLHDLIGAAPSAGRNPAAFVDGSKILPAPPRTPATSAPTRAHDQVAAHRATRMRPDYDTRADGTLHYVSVFNPSVVPFKRMSAFDRVRSDYTLTASSATRVDLPVGGSPSPDRDMFWGSLVVSLSPGKGVAIPSVAPDMRILSYETSPRTQVTFSKDGADNFYVRSDEPGVSGAYRLVFLADADARYFAPHVPHRYRVRDIPPNLRIPLPPGVRATAARALRRLGLSRQEHLDRALDTLVGYFRSFSPKQSPTPTGDIYWDLFSSRAGVCRHRSFAFMITANALGIPTRFVSNEAHAWVESYVPGSGWIRIDLGGAARTLEVQNGAGKSIYRPRGPDPFEQPKQYAQTYTRLLGDVRGLSAEQLMEARAPVVRRSTGGGSATAGGDDGSGASPDEGASSGDDDHVVVVPTEADGADGADGAASAGQIPDRGLPHPPPAASAHKRPTAISVDHADAVGFRGEAITVSGRLTDAAGTGLGDERINVYLAPAGSGGAGAVLIGHSVSRDDGSFTAAATVPRDLDLGDYNVYAASPGDASYRPSVSR